MVYNSLSAAGDPFLTVRLVQIIEDVVGFRQHDVSILEDRNIVLARDFLDHFTHRAKVGHDDLFVFDVEVRQFTAHHLTVGAPGYVIKGQRHTRSVFKSKVIKSESHHEEIDTGFMTVRLYDFRTVPVRPRTAP